MSLFDVLLIGVFPLLIGVMVLNVFCAERFTMTGSRRSLLWGVAIIALWVGFAAYVALTLHLGPPDQLPPCAPGR